MVLAAFLMLPAFVIAAEADDAQHIWFKGECVGTTYEVLQRAGLEDAINSYAADVRDVLPPKMPRVIDAFTDGQNHLLFYSNETGYVYAWHKNERRWKFGRIVDNYPVSKIFRERVELDSN